VANDKRLRVSVIGAGWYAAQNHIPALAACDGVALDGVSRLGADELERVRSHFGFAFASEDYRDVLARKPEAVIVSSPHHLHYEHATAALAAGAHVLCEKPMTLDPAQAWSLVEAARSAKRSLLIANGYHYLPGVSDARRLILGGAVGRIEHVACSFISATRAVFSGGAGMASWNAAFFRPDPSTWRNPSQGGGFAYGQMSHSVALSLWLTGLQPHSVAARTLDQDGVDLCDSAIAQCAGGAVMSFSGAAAAPEGRRAYLRLLISGSEGVLDLAFDRDWCELSRHDGANRAIDIAPGQWVYHCRGPVEALVALARGAGDNCSPGENGALTTAVLAAILQSARDGGNPAPVDGRNSPAS